MPTKHYLRMGFAALVAIAAVANFLQFRSLDDRASARYSAIHRYDTPDLMEIAERGSSNFRRNYGSAMALNAMYPGATIIEGDRALHATRRLAFLSVGRARRIERDGCLALEGFDYRPYIVASDKGGRKGRAFAIAAADPPSWRFVVVRRGKRDVLIDEALLTGDNRSGREGRP